MCGDFTPFISKSFQMWDHFFLLFSPQGFWIFNIFGHPILGSGCKKTLIRYLKSEQTDRQTDGQTGRHFDLKKASAHTSLYFRIFVLDLIFKPFCSFKLLNNQRLAHTKHKIQHRETLNLSACADSTNRICCHMLGARWHILPAHVTKANSHSHRHSPCYLTQYVHQDGAADLDIDPQTMMFFFTIW